MPRETALILIAIATPFVIFALTLAWGDRQTRQLKNEPRDEQPAEWTRGGLT